MTGVEAAWLAEQARVGLLVLVHLGGLIDGSYARREAAQVHERTLLPSDGARFAIPLEDVGPVTYESAQDIERASRRSRPPARG